MRQLTVPNTKTLMDEMVKNVMTGIWPSDITKADRLYYYDTLFEITDPIPDLDFGKVYWELNRWQKFGREYLSQTPLEGWLDRCSRKQPGVSDFAEIGYEFSRAGGSRGHRLLGNCLLGMTFHREPAPRITITSRVTNLIPVGFLELTLANLLVQELQPHFTKPISIHWYVTQIQFSIQWSFPYWYHQWIPQHGKDRLTPFALVWVDRMTQRFLDLVEGRVESYPYQRETRLYQKMQNYDEYYPTLDDLKGVMNYD